MNFFLFSGFLRLMWISSVRLALHSSLNLMLFYDYMIICDYCEYLCISVFFFPFANVCSTHVLNCYDKSKLFRDYMIICDCCDYLCISVCFFSFANVCNIHVLNHSDKTFRYCFFGNNLL